MDRAARNPLTELEVLETVQLERVPADVHARRGRQRAASASDGPEESERLLDDPLGPAELGGLVLVSVEHQKIVVTSDPPDESAPELLVDE